MAQTEKNNNLLDSINNRGVFFIKSQSLAKNRKIKEKNNEIDNNYIVYFVKNIMINNKKKKKRKI